MFYSERYIKLILIIWCYALIYIHYKKNFYKKLILVIGRGVLKGKGPAELESKLLKLHYVFVGGKSVVLAV